MENTPSTEPRPMKFDDLFNKPEEPPRATITSIRPPSSDITAYANAALIRILDGLRATPKGSRNDRLNKAAFRVGQLIASGEIPEHNAVEIGDLLADAARDIGLDARETMNTVRSGINAGHKHPSGAPQPWNGASAALEDNINTATREKPIDPDKETEIDRRQLQIEALYITHEGLAHIRPPHPIIENWLYRNSLAWLAGKPGDGKSFIALDMAYSVATGQPWQGHPTQQGTVLYIAAEGASGLSIRANAWCKANGNPHHIPIRYLPLAVRLTKPDEIDVQALAQALQSLKPTLVIIDTQARVTTGAEENSAKDMGWFIDALETLRAAHPATYLTVHHTPRNGDNLRGSIALEGAAETILLSVKDGNIVTLQCQKQKNAAANEDLKMYMQPIGDSIVMDYKAVEVIKEITPAMEVILKTVLELYGDNEVSATDLEKASGIQGGTYTRARQTLVRDGFLAERESGRSKFYKITGKTHLQHLQTPPTPPGAFGNNTSTPPPPFKGGGVGGIPAK